MKKIEKMAVLVRLVEKFIRGRGSREDYKEVVSMEEDLLNWVLSDCGSEEDEEMTEELRKEYSEKAVALHNKARSLPETECQEMRAMLKPISALLLYNFHQHSAKAISTIIRLLYKGASELKGLTAGGIIPPEAVKKSQRWALNCFQMAGRIYSGVNKAALQASIPTLELQEVNTCMFQSHLNAASLILAGANKDDPADRLINMRQQISRAEEIARQLSQDSRVFFCETLLRFGTDLASGGGVATGQPAALDHALEVLSLANQQLEGMALSVMAGRNSSSGPAGGISAATRKGVRSLKIKVFLSLSFVLMKLDRCAPALEYIKKVEEEAKTLLTSSGGASSRTGSSSSSTEAVEHPVEQMVQYSKFCIFAQDRRWDSAEKSLRSLLRSTHRFETALSMVKTFVEGSKLPTRDSAPYFRALTDKFPEEPYFTEVRLANLQAMISNAEQPDETAIIAGGDASSLSAVDLTLCIVREHESRLRPLTHDNYARLKNILLERVQWSRLTDHPRVVLQWVNCMVLLLLAVKKMPVAVLARLSAERSKQEEKETLTACRLLKSDALCRLHKHAEAYEVATEAFEEDPNNKTLLMCFRCSLSRDPASSAAKLTQMCEELSKIASGGSDGASSSSSSGRSVTTASSSSCDTRRATLETVLLAVAVVRDLQEHELQHQAAHEVTQELLTLWLKRYRVWKGWREAASATTSASAHTSGGGNEAIDPLRMESVGFLRVASALLQGVLSKVLHEEQPGAALPRSPIPPATGITTPTGTAADGSPVAAVEPHGATEKRAPSQIREDEPTKRRRYLTRRTFSQEEVVELRAEMDVQTEGMGDGEGAASTVLAPLKAQITSEATLSSDKLGQAELGSPSPAEPRSSPEGPFEGSSLSNSHFRLKCSLTTLRSGLLQPLSFVCTVLEEARVDGAPLDVLGCFEDAVWLADVAWNLGNLLVLTEQCTIDPDLAKPQQQPPGTPRLLLAAECFEVAESLYTACQSLGQGREMTHVLGKNRYMSLLVAACARLDADSLDITGHAARRDAQLMDLEASYEPAGRSSSTASESGAAATASLVKAHENVTVADRMMMRDVGFEDDETVSIRKTALMLLFTLLCRAGAPLLSPTCADTASATNTTTTISVPPSTAVQLRELISTREQDFLLLSAIDLKKCADIACSEPEGTAEAARLLLQLSWQVCNQGRAPGQSGLASSASTPLPSDTAETERNRLIGNLFCHMIELAPCRDEALNKAQEFLQLLQNKVKPHKVGESTPAGAGTSTNNLFGTEEQQNGVDPSATAAHVPFAQESVDQITAVTYNYGVTLSELGQPKLAEKFINTAIGLMRYASTEMKQWSRRIEDSYLELLSTTEEDAASLQLQSAGAVQIPTAATTTDTSADAFHHSGLSRIFAFDEVGLAPALESVGVAVEAPTD